MQDRVCESERRYRTLLMGNLGTTTADYAKGDRSHNTLNRLARARVWAIASGQFTPIPIGCSRVAWDNVLDKLIVEQLGDRHCLSCNTFFRSRTVPVRVVLARPYNITGPECPSCCSILSESLERERQCTY